MKKYILIGLMIPTILYAEPNHTTGSCSDSKYIDFDSNIKDQVQCENLDFDLDGNMINALLYTSIGKMSFTLDKGRFDDDIVSLKINDTKVDAKGLCISAQNHFFCSISIYDQYKIKTTISINFVEN